MSVAKAPRPFSPQPWWICRTKENASRLKVSIMVITVCSQCWIALNLAFLGKGQRPFCFLPVAMIYRKAALAFNHFPTHPTLAQPYPHLYFAHPPWQDRGLFEKRSLNWICLAAAGPAGWVWVWGMRLRQTPVSGAWRRSGWIPRMLHVDYSPPALLPPAIQGHLPSRKVRQINILMGATPSCPMDLIKKVRLHHLQNNTTQNEIMCFRLLILTNHCKVKCYYHFLRNLLKEETFIVLYVLSCFIFFLYFKYISNAKNIARIANALQCHS